MVDASAMVQVADVLEARKGVAKFVVLSAMGGATDELLRAGSLAKQGDPAWHTLVADLRTRHLDACEGLIQGDGQRAVRDEIEHGFGHIRSICEGLQLLHEFSAHTRDALVSMGERLSVPLMHALLRQRGLDVVRLSERFKRSFLFSVRRCWDRNLYCSGCSRVRFYLVPNCCPCVTFAVGSLV